MAETLDKHVRFFFWPVVRIAEVCDEFYVGLVKVFDWNLMTEPTILFNTL